ncbi:MAG: hypothetical protein IAF08_08855 [Rhizobacter sp.]|nr:hypothetical protein [Chlorobiales bacterium]
MIRLILIFLGIVLAYRLLKAFLLPKTNATFFSSAAEPPQTPPSVDNLPEAEFREIDSHLTGEHSEPPSGRKTERTAS